MKKDLISIIIPCYNAEKFLDDCLSSLLNQTYNHIEVIIVNDGSTDNSENIIDSYVPKFLQKKKNLIKINQENQGQAVAVNNALKVVNGEYLVWQDADDFYELNALEIMHDYLINNKEKDFVRGNVAFINEDDINKIIIIGKSNNPENTKIFDSYVFETDSYCHAGIFMTRMNFFDKCIKNRTIYNSRAGQNWQLILPMAYNGNCGYINKIVYNCRIVENSHSHSIKTTRANLRRCNALKDILFNVLKNIDEMSTKEYLMYTKKIHIKYLKRKIKILLNALKRRIKQKW